MTESALIAHMESLIKEEVGVASGLLLSSPPGSLICFNPGVLFSFCNPPEGYLIALDLNLIRNNSSRTMVFEDNASVPKLIGVKYKPDLSQKVLFASIDSAFLFLLLQDVYG